MAAFLGPTQQSVTAQRYTRGMELLVSLPQSAQYPIDFLVITRVICTREAIQLSAATSEVRHSDMPASGMCLLCA